MELELFTVDAFSPTPFGGNPAAVALLTGPLSDELRQKIAAEMALSETAFIERVRSSLYAEGTAFAALRGLRGWGHGAMVLCSPSSILVHMYWTAALLGLWAQAFQSPRQVPVQTCRRAQAMAAVVTALLVALRP